jgi:hypothetical protein
MPSLTYSNRPHTTLFFLRNFLEFLVILYTFMKTLRVSVFVVWRGAIGSG